MCRIMIHKALDTFVMRKCVTQMRDRLLWYSWWRIPSSSPKVTLLRDASTTPRAANNHHALGWSLVSTVVSLAPAAAMAGQPIRPHFERILLHKSSSVSSSSPRGLLLPYDGNLYILVQRLLWYALSCSCSDGCNRKLEIETIWFYYTHATIY